MCRNGPDSSTEIAILVCRQPKQRRIDLAQTKIHATGSALKVTLLGLAVTLLRHVQRSGMVPAEANLKIQRVIRGTIPQSTGLNPSACRFAVICASFEKDSNFDVKGSDAKG
jgi:hypothetical protein